MCQLKARRQNIKNATATISRSVSEFLTPEAQLFWQGAHKSNSTAYNQHLCADKLSPFVFYVSSFSPSLSLSHLCAGVPAELCWFQVLHREPHKEPGRPKPEAGPDLSALQQNYRETRPDPGQKNQCQRRWWGQVWYGRTPVHLTWHLSYFVTTGREITIYFQPDLVLHHYFSYSSSCFVCLLPFVWNWFSLDGDFWKPPTTGWSVWKWLWNCWPCNGCLLQHLGIQSKSIFISIDLLANGANLLPECLIWTKTDFLFCHSAKWSLLLVSDV